MLGGALAARLYEDIEFPENLPRASAILYIRFRAENNAKRLNLVYTAKQLYYT